jgi:hypothetical protein
MSKKFILDSALGNIGLVAVIENIIKGIECPVEQDLMYSFVKNVTERLSEEDINALTDIVSENLADFSLPGRGTIIMLYNDFLIKKFEGKIICRTKDDKTFEVQEVFRIPAPFFDYIDDDKLHTIKECDFAGELDDASAFIYYKIVEELVVPKMDSVTAIKTIFEIIDEKHPPIGYKKVYNVVVDDDAAVEFTEEELLEALTCEEFDELLEKGIVECVDRYLIKLVDGKEVK